MKIDLKMLLVSLFGVAAIALLFSFEKFTKNFFLEKNRLSTLLLQLDKEETRLDYEILNTSFFLYQNYDRIVAIQKRIEKLLQRVKRSTLAPEPKDLLKRYERAFAKKESSIEEFKSLNAAIKNSIMYLATLLHKLSTLPHKKSIESLATDIIASIFLTKNSMDSDFLEDIRIKYKKLAKLSVPKKIEPFKKVLMAHISIFLKDFPEYKKTLRAILHAPTQKILNSLENSFDRSIQKKTDTITLFFLSLIAFYLLAIVAIIYFLYKLDRENSQLKELQKRLQISAITDDLTKIRNRRAFKQDVRGIKKPFFALVNINGFKHYNDFYGNQVGDHILREVAKFLKIVVPKHYEAKFYRLGGDDFGILIEEKLPIDAATFAQSIIDFFDHKQITFKAIDLFISVSIGMSRKRPLLETADMALKYIKKQSHIPFYLYDEKIGYFQEIKENLKKSKILKNAIMHEKIQPFFQPIIDIKSGKIAKYEALARIKNPDGYYDSIHGYLELAKEMKLYDQITKQMMEKSFAIASSYRQPIAINISMKDIENASILKYLGHLFERYPDIAHLITFEILESETLKDYEAVKTFISVVRSLKCQIAIDDFGAGYSNFAHIFNLHVDQIKIDGSLIKDIDQDSGAQKVVQTIVQLAKDSGIKTVAEFVHSKEVFTMVKKLGIDFAQGYYLGEPKPSL